MGIKPIKDFCQMFFCKLFESGTNFVNKKSVNKSEGYSCSLHKCFRACREYIIAVLAFSQRNNLMFYSFKEEDHV